MSDHDLEQRLRIRLAQLHEEYRERAKPIIDELVKIECRKPPRPLVISIDCAGHAQDSIHPFLTRGR